MDRDINYAWPVTSVNREDMTAFEDWFTDNRDVIERKKIIVWGAGIRGTEFSIFFDRKGFKNICFTDSNRGKWGGNINGFPIIPVQQAYELIEKDLGKILIATENSIDIETGLLNQGYKKGIDFYTAKTDLYKKYISEFKRKYTKEILIMGDCEFTTISLQDKNTSNLAEIFKEELGEDHCKVLAMHGMGLRSHYNIFKAQMQYCGVPDILVLMINFDTLTGKQHLLPRSQHEELLQTVFNLLENGDDEFNTYLTDVHKRAQNIQIEFGTKRNDTTKKQLHDLKAKNYFKINYLYELDENTEGIQYLIKILELAEKKNVRVIPFIPPLNYEYGEQLFGQLFYDKYCANVKKVMSIVQSCGSRLLDLSFLLSAQMFTEEKTADETINEKGREMVKKEIIKAIRGDEVKIDTVKEDIIKILKEINPLEELDEDTDLLDDFLDSIGVVYLINKLEENYKIEIPLDKIELETFKNIESIEKFVYLLKS